MEICYKCKETIESTDLYLSEWSRKYHKNCYKTLQKTVRVTLSVICIFCLIGMIILLISLL